MAPGFSIQMLITAIKKNPAIWDRSCEEYRNKIFTKNAWNEVFKELDPNFESRSKESQNDFGHEIRKKWFNIRDNCIKACKRKIGGAPFQKDYIYQRQLKFLIQSEGYEPFEYSGDGEASDSSLNSSSRYLKEEYNVNFTSESYLEEPPRKMATPAAAWDPLRADTSSVEEATFKDQEDRNISFFKGVLPSVHDFNEDEIVEFQMGVLQLVYSLRNKKKARQNSFNS